MKESGIFPAFDFDKKKGNLLRDDTLIDDDKLSKSGGHSVMKSINPNTVVSINTNEIPTLTTWSQKKFYCVL